MKIFEFFRKFQDGIGEPPWDYYFLRNLDEREYPKYLAKIFNYRTGEKLPLLHGIIDKKRCKTFNQKLQWTKLYGVTPLMRDCTDKVKVRDYVKEKIGEEYLKPVLQIIPNESHCHCEQTNDHLMSARQSTDECNDTPDCRGTDKAVVPRLRFPKFQFRENRVLAEYNDRESGDVSIYFDKIDFYKLPCSFVIKTNHGCKWQYIIKNKEEYLKNKRLFEETRKQITGWLEQDYSFWGGFELNYRGIKPQIIIEEFLGNDTEIAKELELYCFEGKVKVIKKIHNNPAEKISMLDENFSNLDFTFLEKEILFEDKVDLILKKAVALSEKLSEKFHFARLDWIIFKNKLYFNEITFTPYSGFIVFDKKWNSKLGKLINIERQKNGL